MKKKIFLIFIIGISSFLFVQPLPTIFSYKPVFHISEKPEAIMRGTNGSALTVNISFGDQEIKEWIQTLEKPFPLLFIDIEWAKRFPETIELIKQKNIPTGLFGQNGKVYEQDSEKFVEHVKEYEAIFGKKPLWFRTNDGSYPPFLLTLLLEAKVNALSSTLTWQGGEIPPTTAGEIIAIPHTEEARIYLPKLKQLKETRTFMPIEDVLFGPVGNLRKIPK